MTAQTLPNSGLVAGYVDAEDGWGEGMNTNLRLLDALVNMRVEDKDLASPPVSPLAGQVYIVGASPTGAWAGQSGKLAVWCVGDDITSAWLFVAPKSGWRAWVIDESADYRYAAGAWALVPTGGGGGSDPFVWVSVKSGDYTLGLVDANKGVPISTVSGSVCTVPDADMAPFPNGTVIVLYQEGDGAITVAPASGVTIRKRGGGAMATAGRYAMATLTKRLVNEWVFTGDITA